MSHDITTRLAVLSVIALAADMVLCMMGFVSFEFGRFVAGWLALLFCASFIAGMIASVQDSRSKRK